MTLVSVMRMNVDWAIGLEINFDDIINLVYDNQDGYHKHLYALRIW